MHTTTFRLRSARTAAAAGLLGIGITAALAGCSTATSTTGSTGDGSSSDDSSSSSSGASYKDGSYSAEGSYQTPGGQETIKVDVTLAGSKVTEVTVTPEATGGNAEKYQTAFASGISDQVVGKRIDELDGVSRVSGSSLTSGGFAKAIEDIESQAKA